MNPEKVKEKVKLARQAVDGIEEPYKTEAFKIILSKLLDSEKNPQKIDLNVSTEEITKKSSIDDIKEKMKELANKCDLTINELERVISIRDNTIEFICPIFGSDARKHIIVTQCLLISYHTIFGSEWISSQTIIECLRSMGVKDVTNLSFSLKKYPDLILAQGTRGHREYRLTSGQGRIYAFNTMHKLGKEGKI